MKAYGYTAIYAAKSLKDLGLELAGPCSILCQDGPLLQVVELTQAGAITDYRNLRYV